MKLWAGRFTQNTTAAMDDFHSSIAFDSRLYLQDIAGSIAHAKMLGKQGIISAQDATEIVKGLQEIKQEIANGDVVFDIGAEDIHMNIESLLIAKIGEAGKRVHTGRSRNDQVALDMKLYLKEQTLRTKELLCTLCKTLINTAKLHTNSCLSGYTHLQKAQPITLGHHIMAYAEMFLRDIDRLGDCLKRMDTMPLGSGALAGSTYNLDRDFVAKELGFSAITANSLDGVSDRDHCIEYCCASSLIMMHLSRFCEELVIWSSDEFKYIEMDDSYSTGSSIMPQKKNPDVAELIRGKTGRVYGDLTALLTMMKGLPLAYNKDMQEDKEAVFDCVDTVCACVEMFEAMFATITFKTEVMQKGALNGFANATDAADYLVKKGLPFRTAHEVIGALVLHCIKHGMAIEQCSLADLKQFNDIIEEDIFEAISLKTCVGDRAVAGGPAPQAVIDHINDAQDRLANFLK